MKEDPRININTNPVVYSSPKKINILYHHLGCFRLTITITTSPPREENHNDFWFSQKKVKYKEKKNCYENVHVMYRSSTVKHQQYWIIRLTNTNRKSSRWFVFEFVFVSVSVCVSVFIFIQYLYSFYIYFCNVSKIERTRSTGGPSSLPTSPAAAWSACLSYSGRTRPRLVGTWDSSWRWGRSSRRTHPSSPTHHLSGSGRRPGTPMLVLPGYPPPPLFVGSASQARHPCSAWGRPRKEAERICIGTREQSYDRTWPHTQM